MRINATSSARTGPLHLTLVGARLAAGIDSVLRLGLSLRARADGCAPLDPALRAIEL